MNFSLKNTLSKFLSKFQGKATIEQMIAEMPEGYKERSAHVGQVHLEGYRYIAKESAIKKFASFFMSLIGGHKEPPVIYCVLKFRVNGAVHNRRYNVYTAYLEIPFVEDIERINLLDVPAKIYCSCDSFKYFMAYVLNETEQVFLLPTTEKDLGIALSQAPVVRNPKELKFMCKHLFKVVNHIKTKRLQNLIKGSRKLSEKELAMPAK